MADLLLKGVAERIGTRIAEQARAHRRSVTQEVIAPDPNPASLQIESAIFNM